ncbi:MAG: hypothetical protein Q8P25_00015 [Candidatus Curtissbacteria bacterium]|nr:hypothetical protein [Candidatus Curtissbacteria bacterium]
MENEVLDWGMTPIEQRERNQKILLFLLFLLPIFVGIIMAAISAPEVAFSNKERLSAIPFSISIIVGIIILSLIINKLVPYKKRAYNLDSQGITISRGDKKKHYLWSDFECFYLYVGRRGSAKLSKYPNKYIGREDIKMIDRVGEEIQGQIFYLRKKSSNVLSKIFKSFVVIYTNPDNSRAVKNFLSEYVQEKEMEAGTDLGIVIYEFK